MMINTELINEKMRTKGLTNEKLAAAAGLTPTTISYLRNGVRTPDTTTLIKVAKVLGVSVEKLFDTEAA